MLLPLLVEVIWLNTLVEDQMLMKKEGVLISLLRNIKQHMKSMKKIEQS